MLCNEGSAFAMSLSMLLDLAASDPAVRAVTERAGVELGAPGPLQPVLVAAAARGALTTTAAFVTLDLAMSAVAVLGGSLAHRARPSP